MILKLSFLNFIFPGLFGLCLLLASSMSPVEAAESGDIEDGKLIAETLCSGCHSISAEGDSPFSKAPPFHQVVKNWSPEILAKALSEGIVVGHEAMPEFQFGPEVLADFLAYLSTLPKNDLPLGTHQ